MVTLGMWQVQRMAWKQDIIANLDTLYEGMPQAYNYQSLTKANTHDEKLLYGTVTGRPLLGKQMLFGPKPHDGKIGYHVVTPIALNGGTVLVQRGFIEKDKVDSLKSAVAPRNVSFTGVIRKPDWNKYTPNNSPENGIWSKLDINEIADYQKLKNIVPYILYTAKASNSFDAVTPLSEKWYPRNKHRQYALFWFSMALIFLGFFAFVATRSRKK